MTPEARLRARHRLYFTAAFPPPAFWSAIEHARRHAGDKIARMKQAAWWKAQGVKNGISDFNLWCQQRFVGIELKVHPNKPTDAEIAFGEAMRANGFDWFVSFSLVETDAELRRLGFNILPSMRVLALQHDAALSVPEPARKPRSTRRWDRMPTGEQVAAESADRLQQFLDEG